jgi:class 3 adenylate cyclase
VAIPATRYALTADGVSIAYQTLGAGPLDVVLLRAWHTNLEHDWEERVLAQVFRRIGGFARLILFDRRGTGLSDAIGADPPELDARVDDLTAVLDAAGSETAALITVGITGAPSIGCFFAATHPARTSALVLYNPSACGHVAPDYPWGVTHEETAADLAEAKESWGDIETVVAGLAVRAPSRASDRAFAEWLAASQRRSASPRAAQALIAMEAATDVREVLPAISCRTLVIRRGPLQPVDEAAWITGQIRSARLLDLPGPDHMLLSGDTDGVLDEIERFLTGGLHTAPVLDRVLATILFTDLVASTEELARLGDHGWTELIARHHAVVRGLLATYRGRELDTAGDGFFAVFDGPARAVRCAQQIVEDVSRLGLTVRAGVHTGECEVLETKLAGLAVVVAARVMALATPGTVLVTSTVKDLTAGAGIDLIDAGNHELKGIPGSWQLFTAAPG